MRAIVGVLRAVVTTVAFVAAVLSLMVVLGSVDAGWGERTICLAFALLYGALSTLAGYRLGGDQ